MSRRIVTAREQHEMLSPWRQAAFSNELTQRLHDEFHQWYNAGGHALDDKADARQRAVENYNLTDKGPLSHWPNIENFMAEKYPAAHRGLEAGMEHAGPLLDGDEPWYDVDNGGVWKPYETGVKAERRYGYDPKEIASAFVLMHLQSHGPGRENRWPGITDDAQARLVDIARQRYRMQRRYEQRHTTAARTAMPARDAYDDRVPSYNRSDDQQVHPGPWYHGTDHDLPVGTMLTPGGGRSQWQDEDYYGKDRANRQNWVWMDHSPHRARVWGQHLYEVEPLDEGPWEWNGGGGGLFGEGYVSPRARIVRKLGPEDLRVPEFEPLRPTSARRDPDRPMGININDTHQDYTGQILRGEKTIETRNTPSLHPYVGRRIAIYRTDKTRRGGEKTPTLVVGHATVGEPIFYPDADSFDADYHRHLVGPDSPEHISSPANKTGTKYGYPMLDPVALDKPMLVLSKGIVARGAEESDFAPYDGPWPLHTGGFRDDERTRRWEERERQQQEAGWSYDFDAPRDVQYKPNDWQPTPAPAPPDAVWHHVSLTDLAPGTVLTPGGGDSQWGNRFHSGPNEARGKWTWMDTPEKADWWDESGSGHVYEVRPSQSPHPWNNTGADGWVAPSATVIRKVRGPRR